MSIALRDGVARLEIASRVILGVLALAGGVHTYLGVRDPLNGNATTRRIVFFKPAELLELKQTTTRARPDSIESETRSRFLI